MSISVEITVSEVEMSVVFNTVVNSVENSVTADVAVVPPETAVVRVEMVVEVFPEREVVFNAVVPNDVENSVDEVENGMLSTVLFPGSWRSFPTSPRLCHAKNTAAKTAAAAANRVSL